ncbi:hypothetical protein OS493_007882 [Desmophyllum pertusum]|uniref:Uncharacterized protein n=1 Tax=Desmophyllum pertusum TaxID=174260 RepID=A0A9X0CHZ1_9CNID|nr:hypothetical protein OS493_007882 [Desmophyllum pertusum]
MPSVAVGGNCMAKITLFFDELKTGEVTTCFCSRVLLSDIDLLKYEEHHQQGKNIKGEQTCTEDGEKENSTCNLTNLCQERATHLPGMDEPDEAILQELEMMKKMGLPTCFFKSPCDFDSEEKLIPCKDAKRRKKLKKNKPTALAKSKQVPKFIKTDSIVYGTAMSIHRPDDTDNLSSMLETSNDYTSYEHHREYRTKTSEQDAAILDSCPAQRNNVSFLVMDSFGVDEKMCLQENQSVTSPSSGQTVKRQDSEDTTCSNRYPSALDIQTSNFKGCKDVIPLDCTLKQDNNESARNSLESQVKGHASSQTVSKSEIKAFESDQRNDSEQHLKANQGEEKLQTTSDTGKDYIDEHHSECLQQHSINTKAKCTSQICLNQDKGNADCQNVVTASFKKACDSERSKNLSTEEGLHAELERLALDNTDERSNTSSNAATILNVNDDKGWENYWKIYGYSLVWESWKNLYPKFAGVPRNLETERTSNSDAGSLLDGSVLENTFDESEDIICSVVVQSDLLEETNAALKREESVLTEVESCDDKGEEVLTAKDHMLDGGISHDAETSGKTQQTCSVFTDYTSSVEPQGICNISAEHSRHAIEPTLVNGVLGGCHREEIHCVCQCEDTVNTACCKRSCSKSDSVTTEQVNMLWEHTYWDVYCYYYEQYNYWCSQGYSFDGHLEDTTSDTSSMSVTDYEAYQGVVSYGSGKKPAKKKKDKQGENSQKTGTSTVNEVIVLQSHGATSEIVKHVMEMNRLQKRHAAKH